MPLSAEVDGAASAARKSLSGSWASSMRSGAVGRGRVGRRDSCRRTDGRGDLLDVRLLEGVSLRGGNHPVVSHALCPVSIHRRAARSDSHDLSWPPSSAPRCRGASS
eukprot:314869-Prymnesium_polylepis.1